ncbi:hypothetical protein ETAA8_27900 [Anatilimnocola aggregata]|uniref:Uncharacterized protein n=1 Tax=Anatilimnocola aggregata TaxID=2528021 RepID=A0A517YBW0_9BACT|nr:hypothetical protein [Anatilimnocola aggregata]QDU27701.1 hypothetical protein ETAA8_27900 [Anatilimnocola aggregata]
MRKPNYNVQLLETAAEGDAFLPAKELLPWADPYIAALVGRLEAQDEEENETWDFDAEALDKDAEEAEDAAHYWLSDELAPEDDDWHLDRAPAVPPVYGGWPLLNDLPAESRHENV